MRNSASEATRWFKQALNDYQFVQWLGEEAQFPDKGCFISQQAGEKALKACLYAMGKRVVLGHALSEVIQELKEADGRFLDLVDEAKKLDRFYIPTRYPNGLPGGTPYESYTESDLGEAEGDLSKIIRICREFLEERGYSFPEG